MPEAIELKAFADRDWSAHSRRTLHGGRLAHPRRRANHARVEEARRRRRHGLDIDRVRRAHVLPEGSRVDEEPSSPQGISVVRRDVDCTAFDHARQVQRSELPIEDDTDAVRLQSRMEKV